MKRYDILIVGAGHAGAQAAILLRQHGFEGTVAIVSGELELPYERPPLSKDYLAGEKAFERILIRPQQFWEDRSIDLITGTWIGEVRPEEDMAVSVAGERFGYGTMIWAAGGTPHRLRCDGGDLEGVHVVRTRGDADGIRAELLAAEKVAIVGGGYVGLETAAVMTALGKNVVLVEAEDRLLSRVAGADIGRFYEAEHRASGVDVRLSAQVESIVGHGGRANGVQLAGGETIAADLVIVGIGIAAAADPLLEAGAAGGNGVHVDPFCRTSLPGIYAIGDCAAHENRFAGGARIRLESVQNAHDQANTAVKAILGRAEPYDAVPWFWSNQYDLKLQSVGLSMGHDMAVVRGNPAERSFSVVYLKGGRVIALDCVNSTRDYVQGRKLVLDGARPDPDRLKETSVPLKSLA